MIGVSFFGWFFFFGVKGEAAPPQMLPFTSFCVQLCIFIFNSTSLSPVPSRVQILCSHPPGSSMQGRVFAGSLSHVRCHCSEGLLHSACSLRELGMSEKLKATESSAKARAQDTSRKMQSVKRSNSSVLSPGTFPPWSSTGSPRQLQWIQERATAMFEVTIHPKVSSERH